MRDVFRKKGLILGLNSVFKHHLLNINFPVNIIFCAINFRKYRAVSVKFLLIFLNLGMQAKSSLKCLLVMIVMICYCVFGWNRVVFVRVILFTH